VRTGYDLPLIRKIRAVTDASIVASGGAGTMEHFAEAAEAGADVLLAASVFHFKVIGIPELKAFLKGRGFSVR
jgi:cyclase